MLLAVCMVFAAAPSLGGVVVPTAKADAVTYSVPAGTTVADITSQLASYSAGTEVNMILQGNIDYSNKTSESNLANHATAEYTAITVPAGITVNLYMNGKNIVSSHTSKDDGAAWQIKGIIAIQNNGNLNIYSGGSPSNPVLNTGVAKIEVYNERTGMTCKSSLFGNDNREKAYSRIDAIVNNGNLSINRNVQIFVHNYLGYDDQATDGCACTVAATGIYNSDSNCVCILNSTKIDVLAQAYGLTARTTDDKEHSRAFAYAVYGGKNTINGDTDIHVNAYGRMGCANSGASNKQNGNIITVAYGICSAGPIEMYGGTISYGTDHACNEAVTDKGSSWSYEGGICYQSTPPVLADGTIRIAEDAQYTHVRGNNKTFRECTVTRATALPYSGKDLFCGDSTPGTSFAGVYLTFNEPSYPTSGVAAGQYKDEAGNTYNCEMNSIDAANTHAAKIIHGASEGYNRVHIVYRYWENSGRTNLLGYSFKPVSDETVIVENVITLGGLTANNYKPSGGGISYSSGGEAKNSYYWKPSRVTCRTEATKWFSDYDFSLKTNESVLKNFDTGTSSSLAASDAVHYVYVDYIKQEPTEISASAASSTTYTGVPVKASAINLTITDPITGENHTSEYNRDLNNSALIQVNYSWTGTTAAGASVSSTANCLPTDAGIYSVTVKVDDTTGYDIDSAKNKNRYALNADLNAGTDGYTFTLTINPAEVRRGSLPESISAVYGEKLSSKINLSPATGVKPNDLNGNSLSTGVFSFVNYADGDGYKPAGSGVVQIKWTPGSPCNYKETVFNVNYTVAKAPLYIIPNGGEITYGENATASTFSSTYSDLVAGDNNAEVIAQIQSVLDYSIYVNNAYTQYSAGDVPANESGYTVKAAVNPGRVSDAPALRNYDYTTDLSGTEHTAGKLKVMRRTLNVKATAQSRAYDPASYSVNVSYEVTGGRYGADSVYFTDGTGTLSYGSNTVGTQIVNGVTNASATACMTGTNAANYKITADSISYATGADLTVEITKATPNAAVPVLADTYYGRLKTLADISLGTPDNGAWVWVDDTINPTVAVSSYTAKFVPSDTANYNEKTANITLNVVPTPVTVTYTGTVEYGDPIPNIRQFAYICPQDPNFDINYVSCTGNPSSSTTYVKGSPVVSQGYPVTIALNGYADTDGNYVFTSQNGKITVTKRHIEFTVQDVEITYGDTWNTSMCEVTFDESRLIPGDTAENINSAHTYPTFAIQTTYSAANNNAGRYNLNGVANFTPSDNYTVSVVAGTLNVKKKAIVLKANDFTVSYGSALPSDFQTRYTFIGAKTGDTHIISEGTISLSTDYIAGQPVTSEGYPVYIDMSGATFNNYTVSAQQGRITVAKATPVITTYPSASIVYSQALSDAVFSGAAVAGGVEGRFVYESAETVPAYSDNQYQIYTAKFIPADTDNYNTVSGFIVPLTVNKMPVTGALAVNGIPMVGETLTVVTSGLNPSDTGVYTYKWYVESSVVGTGTSLELVEAYETKSVTVIATAQGYYSGTVQYIVPSVAPVLTDVKTIINGTYFTVSGIDAIGGSRTVTYSGVPQSVTLTQTAGTLGSAKIGTVTVKYNGSTTQPTDAGTYAVTVDIATPDLTNYGADSLTYYSPVTGHSIGTLVIQKKAYNVTVSVNDKVYDGSNAASATVVSEQGRCGEDDVRFDTSAAVYTFDNANAGVKNVAVSNAVLKGAKKNNYEISVALESQTAEITRRTLRAAAVPVSREYVPGDYEVEVTFTTDVTSLAPTDSTSDIYVNDSVGTVDNCNACADGTFRAVTVSNAVLAGRRAQNYTLELTNANSAKVVIEKSTDYDYPLPDAGEVTYTYGRRLSEISLGNSRWGWDSSVANEVPTAGMHYYTAVYTPADTNNYASIEQEVALNVHKAAAVVEIASFNIIYGENEPTYYYTVRGLGADRVENLKGGYVALECSYVPGADAGTYDICLTSSSGFEDDNYTFTYPRGTLTVSNRPVYTTATAVSRDYESGNTAVTVTLSALSGIYGGDASNVYLETYSVTGSVVSDTAGTKTVTFDMPAVAGPKAANYDLYATNSDVKVVINKAHMPGVTLPTSGEVTYNHRLSETVFTSSYEGASFGTFSMDNPSSKPAAYGTFDDVYMVVFTPANTTNYAVEKAYIRLTVNKETLPVELAVAGDNQAGKKLYVVTNALPEDAYNYIEYRWYRLNSYGDDYRSSGTLIASGESTEYTLTESDIGKYIVCVASPKSNSPYVLSAEAKYDMEIERSAAADLSFWQRIKNWFYRLLSSFTQLFGHLGK